MSCSTTNSLNTQSSSLDTSSSLSFLSDKSLNNSNKPLNSNFEFINCNKNKNENYFSVGDEVKIIVDLDLFEKLQKESHGGWNNKMAQLIGKIGRVHRMTEKGDIRVNYDYEPNARWTIFYHILNKVDLNFSPGDKVRINSDERVVSHLVKDKWNDSFKQILGKSFKINRIKSTGDLCLTHHGTEYIIPKECCYLISNNRTSEINKYCNLATKSMVKDFKEISLDAKSSTNLSATALDYLVQKSAKGNLKKVKQILAEYPEILNEKSFGKTALHASCYQGHKDIVNYLIELKANLEVKDSDGDSAIHYSCFGNRPVIIDLLAQNKADLNSLNKNRCSALHVAVNKQFVESVKALIRNNCNVNIQDSYGDTPLHDIIGKKKTRESIEIIDLLIQVPELDLNLKNKRGFNLLHHASLKGNVDATQKILNKMPEMINLQKDDGYVALHLASLNGHKELIECLIKNKADLEIKNSRHQTALLLSIAQFHIQIVEILVENHADVNSYDEDYDTCLHLVLNEILEKESNLVQSPTKSKVANLDQALNCLSDCKNISEVLDIIPCEYKSNIRLILAVYLLKSGANLYARNKSLQICLDYVNDCNIKEFLINFYSNLNQSLNTNLIYENIYSNNSILKCKLCDEEPVSVKFLPCNHKCVCLDCSIRIRKCIECNQVIKEKQTSNGTNLNLNKIEFSELLEKVKHLEEAQICSICMERKKDTTFQCGHIVCRICSVPLLNCHICRKSILTKIKIYEN